MRDTPLPAFEEAFTALRQFTRVRRPTADAVEFCELCSAGLAHEHPHLVELSSRQILCAAESSSGGIGGSPAIATRLAARSSR